MSAGWAGVATPSIVALSCSAETSNSRYWLVTPSTITTPPPGAAVVTVPSTGGCAGASGMLSASSIGTSSATSDGALTTGHGHVRALRAR